MKFRLSLSLLCLTAVVVLASPLTAAAQFSANAYYHIKPRHALQAGYNLCLDVENVSALDNAKIQQYTCNTSWPQDNQLWTLVPTGSGTYRLVAAISAKCLDVLNPQNGSGAAFQQYACNLLGAQSNQSFNVVAAGTAGYYRISSAYSGGSQCLDVPFSSLTAGQDVQQWACGPWWQDNQDWQIVATPWARSPVGHVQYFGWYGEAATAADDHANMVVYTAASLPQIASRPAHVKAKLALVDFVVLKPKNADLWANQPNGSDGGLRSDICQHWSLTRASIASYMPRVAAFYLDEPIWNLWAYGFSTADATTIIQTVAQVVKGGACPGGPTDPAIPFAVVEAWPTAHLQQPSAVDWVGFDCYEDPNDCNGPGDPATPNYVSLWNAQKAALQPHQKLIAVPPARVDFTPIPKAGWPNCELSTAIGAVTPTQANNEAGRAHFYLTLALSDPKTVAVWPWHGPSRYFHYLDSSGNYIANPCLRDGIIVGGHDIPTIKAHWRFLARAIGFGQ